MVDNKYTNYTWQDFPSALGLPNVVLTGLTVQNGDAASASQVALVLLVSSPSYNASTGLLTFSATKLPHWDADLYGSLKGWSTPTPWSSFEPFQLWDANIFIDSTAADAADAGSGSAAGIVVSWFEDWMLLKTLSTPLKFK